MKDLHFLALDGGGTGCRAMLCAADGRELGRAMGGGANLTSDFKAAHDNIHKAIGDVYQAAGLPQSAMSAGVAVLGVAGADIGNAAARLQDGLGFANRSLSPTGRRPSPGFSVKETARWRRSEQAHSLSIATPA